MQPLHKLKPRSHLDSWQSSQSSHSSGMAASALCVDVRRLPSKSPVAGKEEFNRRYFVKWRAILGGCELQLSINGWMPHATILFRSESGTGMKTSKIIGIVWSCLTQSRLST